MPRKDASPHDREVGRRIKMRRRELGLSQSALGDAINLTFQQVQKYEKGANRVAAGRLQHIAKILKVPVSFFFDELGGSSGGGSEISAMLDSAYGLRVLKAFSKIQDRSLQRSTVELMEKLAEIAVRHK